jgi:hypothetical protein
MMSSRYNSRIQMSSVPKRTAVCKICQVIIREVVAWRSVLTVGVRRGIVGSRLVPDDRFIECRAIAGPVYRVQISWDFIGLI